MIEKKCQAHMHVIQLVTRSDKAGERFVRAHVFMNEDKHSDQGTPSSAQTATVRFNWRGNRPRMGKRSMCPACGYLYHAPAMGLCLQCGEGEVVDVSYDDPPQNI